MSELTGSWDSFLRSPVEIKDDQESRSSHLVGRDERNSSSSSCSSHSAILCCSCYLRTPVLYSLVLLLDSLGGFPFLSKSLSQNWCF